MTAALLTRDPLDAYQDTASLVRDITIEAALAAWGMLDDYRDSDTDRLVSAVVPRVQAGQIQVANLTAVYLGGLAVTGAVLLGRHLILNARGKPAEEVYRRPTSTVHAALSKGKPLAKAVEMGRNRLKSLVATDLQMAKVRQADESLRQSGAKYYRRVLNGDENCAKCVIASTQRYRVGKLLPIHPGCDCGVAPLEGDDMPQVIDPVLLEATHEQVETFAAMSNRPAVDYENLIVTHEHGEIGPVLSWRHQQFTGPADI